MTSSVPSSTLYVLVLFLPLDEPLRKPYLSDDKQTVPCLGIKTSVWSNNHTTPVLCSSGKSPPFPHLGLDPGMGSLGAGEDQGHFCSTSALWFLTPLALEGIVREFIGKDRVLPARSLCDLLWVLPRRGRYTKVSPLETQFCGFLGDLLPFFSWAQLSP